MKEREEVINLFIGEKKRNTKNINLLDTVKKEIFRINNKVFSETKKYENEKSVLLENCVQILDKFNKELPIDINDILLIISKQLNDKTDSSENAIVAKYKNYDDALNQIVKGNKLRPEIADYILNKNGRWFIEEGYNEATTKEILNILKLVKLSKTLIKITFVNNPNFNKECENAYLEAIKANNSLITIILCKTNVSNQMVVETLKMLKEKQKIKVLIVEQSKIGKNEANELAKNMKLEIKKKKIGVKSNNKCKIGCGKGD